MDKRTLKLIVDEIKEAAVNCLWTAIAFSFILILMVVLVIAL